MLQLVLNRILNTVSWIGNPSKERNDVQPVPWDIIDPEQLFNLPC